MVTIDHRLLDAPQREDIVLPALPPDEIMLAARRRHRRRGAERFAGALWFGATRCGSKGSTTGS
jgi:hypothetical protein